MALSALALSFEACAKSTEKAEAAAQENYSQADMDQPSNVLSPTSDSQFRPGFKPAKPTMIDFNATWCGPCQLLAPGFDLAAAKYAGKVDFYSIDVDNFPKTAEAYNVHSIPYVMIVMPDGSMTSHIGLNDFIDGLNTATDPSEAQITDAVFDNISKMLDDAVK